ncbi:hypothetical protein K474DRAFT_1649089 [Panus rudis PR-1116 ss-1]|nr:hypothetical protein K474DRAFT_1649089 [Panus rudis PR-1116 ss-1]
MHLLWENVIKNLFSLWTGQYKGLDEGQEHYQLDKKVWEAIGEASEASGATIPYIFGQRPPNVASDKTMWTAELRCFWTQYMGPVLLQHRLNDKFYKHFVDLVKLINTCLQFSVTKTEVTGLREGFIKWVKDYEGLYYQQNPSWLATCPVTIHALLHIADSIVAASPVWAYWAFPMERYCGALQPAIRSRRYPYASLNRYVVDHDARMKQIKLRYDLQNELSRGTSSRDNRVIFPNYETCSLLTPQETVILTTGQRTQALGGLSTRFTGLDFEDVKRMFVASAKVEEFGRLQIFEDGDQARTSNLGQKKSEDRRDATFVRYSMFLDRHATRHHVRPEFDLRTFYGQLENLFVIKPLRHLLPPAKRAQVPPIIILAFIRRCNALKKHRYGLDIHNYTGTGGVNVVEHMPYMEMGFRLKRGYVYLLSSSYL